MATRGRPRVRVTPVEVTLLRDLGLSWRQIARELGIGKTTAWDLLRQAQEYPKPLSEKAQEARLGDRA